MRTFGKKLDVVGFNAVEADAMFKISGGSYTPAGQIAMANLAGTGWSERVVHGFGFWAPTGTGIKTYTTTVTGSYGYTHDVTTTKNVKVNEFHFYDKEYYGTPGM